MGTSVLVYLVQFWYLVSLRVFSLEMSTSGSFAVHSRVLSHKKYDILEIMHCIRIDQFHILYIELEIAWNLHVG